ncbi:hypothetical protein M9458_016597, partial [Cirrhinus mrigala]
WTPSPTTLPSRVATRVLCACRTHTHGQMASRCLTGTFSCTRGTSPSWACPRRSRSLTTG